MLSVHLSVVKWGERVEMIPRWLTSSSTTTSTFSCSLQGSLPFSVYCHYIWIKANLKRYFNKMLKWSLPLSHNHIFCYNKKWTKMNADRTICFVFTICILLSCQMTTSIGSTHTVTLSGNRCIKQKLHRPKTAGKHTVLFFVFLLFSVSQSRLMCFCCLTIFFFGFIIFSIKNNNFF